MPRRTTLTPQVHDAIVQSMRMAHTRKEAFDLAEVAQSTARSWLARGRHQRWLLGENLDIEPDGARYLALLEGVEKADTEAKQALLLRIQERAQGTDGAVVTRTTRKVQNGQVVEESTVSETLRPEWTAAAWVLERRWPGEFSRHESVDVRTQLDPGRVRDVLVRVLRGVIDSDRVGLSDVQRRVAREVLSDELRVVADLEDAADGLGGDNRRAVKA